MVMLLAPEQRVKNTTVMASWRTGALETQRAENNVIGSVAQQVVGGVSVLSGAWLGPAGTTVARASGTRRPKHDSTLNRLHSLGEGPATQRAAGTAPILW